jgi:S1-C subfamily serine protease
LLASLSLGPPPLLQKLPHFPEINDGLDTALLATVEIYGKSGGGSGCIISGNGLILTNWHVVRNNAGFPSENISVAVNLSPSVPPREVFKASVVAYKKEKDLALLQITSGFYDTPIPESYAFPHFRFGDPDLLRIGDEIGLIGFPEIGGTGSRASVTFTRGIVSGFEKTAFGEFIKTDGQISPGNSGGAATNSNYHLIGIPTMIIHKNSSQIGFIYPVSLLPPEWIEMIPETEP